MGMSVLRYAKQRQILLKLRRSQARCQHRLYKLRVETGGWAELAEILSGVRQTASMKR